MSVIATRKCVRHPVREAVARCSSCEEHFCRECVVEHEGVLLCAVCLAREAATKTPEQKSAGVRVGKMVLTVACVLLLWVVFYGFGQLLKTIPPSVHEGTIWRGKDS
ncbi:MAG: rhomboid family protein [Lacunisphaera sp.]